MIRHQLTFDARKEAQLCLVQAGGWITFHHKEPIFVFSTAEEKQIYMTLMADKATDANKEGVRAT
ncbi:hypothetical protein [Bacillus zhangzhouensis]|uniref:hypothetical protein n=1 Tax=Bacillus zhangzhouensis TaxID=1178540 RepID=UPI0028143575|nr:hypothetical protein [Bacillus zhangzhouensis]MDR0125301.1 hypothetical protein [Bacillus zhangzhouensis]